jgi:hypothetical protein
MIPCQKCNRVNPLGTVFCHGCGVRLVVNYQQVAESVAGTAKANVDDATFGWGRGSLMLCSFLMVCALVLRYGLVPAMPVLELPPAPALPLFPKEAPAWIEKAKEASTATDDGAVLAPNATNDDIAPPLPASGSKLRDLAGRLGWRRDFARSILGDLRVDRKRLRGWQKSILASYDGKGSFAGEDPIAATSLCLLALQAWPSDEAVAIVMGQAQAWLLQQTPALAQKPALVRTLAVLALMDAEALPEAVRTSLSPTLIDGGVPQWQAYMLALHPNADRPTQLASLRNVLRGPQWDVYFELIGGGIPRTDPTLFSATAIKGLTTGEDRLAWAFLAWHMPVAPKELGDTLRTWAAENPAIVDPELVKKVGPRAPEALALLTILAPLRLQPLWLQR